ncbi:MAG TPA: MATE family efflux transporter, partial [Longimicrobiales bacterium]|nr:MATE family efflux transporter [Longimicrobiales bacterium]
MTGPAHREGPKVGRREILGLAWPIVLANAATPLLGLVDTAVIGNTGSVEELGAIALGALIFNFVYWSFGFLRMGTTGFTAQASGAGDTAEVRATLARALLLAGGIGG